MNNEMIAAYTKMLNAIIDYAEYEYSGDPWEEDARAMGEMEIDALKSPSEIIRLREILTAFVHQ